MIDLSLSTELEIEQPSFPVEEGEKEAEISFVARASLPTSQEQLTFTSPHTFSSLPLEERESETLENAKPQQSDSPKQMASSTKALKMGSSSPRSSEKNPSPPHVRSSLLFSSFLQTKQTRSPSPMALAATLHKKEESPSKKERVGVIEQRIEFSKTPKERILLGRERERREDKEQEKEDKEEKKRPQKIGSIDKKRTPFSPQISALPRKKPVLVPPPEEESAAAPAAYLPPTLPHLPSALFTLYYLMNKLSLLSENLSAVGLRQLIESHQQEVEAVHERRIEALQKVLTAEKRAQNWKIMTTLFAWTGIVMAIVTGVLLVTTGVGLVAGTLLVAGGILTLTDQALDISHAWDEIASLLPVDDPEQQRSIISWIRLSLLFVSLAVSGASIGMTGFSQVWGISQMGSSLTQAGAVGAAALAALGKGAAHSSYFKALSQLKGLEMELIDLEMDETRHRELLEHLLSCSEGLFEGLSLLEQLKVDINRSYQNAWR